MRILAKILCEITRHPRYKVDYEWSDSLVDNCFILFYRIFWRRDGVKLEMAVGRNMDGSEFRTYYTWRTYLISREHYVKEFFRELLSVRVWIPILRTPQGIPFLASPYVFAIAFGNHYENTGVSPLTIASVVVASGGTLVVCAAINGTGTVTTVLFNTTESLTQIITHQNAAGTRCTFDIWQIAAASATTASVIVTTTAASNYDVALVYTGAKTTGLMSNTNWNTGTGAAQSVQLTGCATSSWTIGADISDNASALSGTGWTVRNTNGAPPAGDSTGTVGASSFTMNGTGNSADNWVFVGSELQIPGAATTVKVKPTLLYLGVG